MCAVHACTHAFTCNARYLHMPCHICTHAYMRTHTRTHTRSKQTHSRTHSLTQYHPTYLNRQRYKDVNAPFQADLKAVSPSEEFDCSLGVDPAVKVVYKPMHKFREQSGFMAKHVTFTYRQEIELKNTRQDEITVHVVDQLPQSMEEKIKVGTSPWSCHVGYISI